MLLCLSSYFPSGENFCQPTNGWQLLHPRHVFEENGFFGTIEFMRNFKVIWRCNVHIVFTGRNWTVHWFQTWDFRKINWAQQKMRSTESIDAHLIKNLSTTSDQFNWLIMTSTRVGIVHPESPFALKYLIFFTSITDRILLSWVYVRRNTISIFKKPYSSRFYVIFL